MPPSRLAPGTTVADRFRIEAEAGAGGMGVVYRALDRESGGPVALKILHDDGSVDATRFARERAILAALDHPGVVRYVAHSEPGARPAWLAMEWLDGETLAARLRRGPLGAVRAVRLVRDVARSLGRVHAAGIVHRDLKPANVFLTAGEPGAAKLLDFGIARRTGTDASTLTTTGTVLGTPAYMAPEQARGSRDVDPRADVYALGCLLYEALTGSRPFEHESVVAVLAAVLLEEAPAPRDRVQGIPDVLDALVLRMMSKRAADRPSNGDEAAALLDALLEDESLLRSSMSPSPRALTTREQRVVCVVLVEAGATPPPDGRTLRTSVDEDLGGRVRGLVEPFSGEVISLADGSLVITVGDHGTASDQAERAARCALAVRGIAPEVAVAIAAGRALVTGRIPVGEVVQRGAEMLHGARRPAAPGRADVPLDDAIASLLDHRFAIETRDGAPRLDGFARDPDTPRDPRPASRALVGRERELAQLEGLLAECVGEPVARVVQLVGAPGAGKSRLLEAFLARAATAGHRVVSVHADALGEGAPFAIAGELVRDAAGIVEGESLGGRHDKLVRLAVSRRDAVVLGELARAPFPEDADAVVAGLRRDPVLRGDLERRAFEDWLDRETTRAPMVLAVDDAHHADRATLTLLDGVLGHLRERPLFVVLAGRAPTEGLFRDRDLVGLALGRLLPRAARTLVERALGPQGRAADVERIVAQGDGNPLYLEELARASREGEDAPPTGVLAMVEARLAALDGETRRVARAASVFGLRAPEGGVQLLAGRRGIEPALHELAHREILVGDRTARAGARWLTWRQPLVREAAYAMLTDEDRALGHRLAGEWLAEHAEVEPSVLAHHFELGGAGDVAARAWAGAADLALGASDLAAAIAHAERGLSLAADPALRAGLLSCQAEALKWRADYVPALACAAEALELAVEGSDAWLAAASTYASSAIRLDRQTELGALASRLEALVVHERRAPSQIALLCRVASHDLATHRDAAYRARMTRAETLAAGLPRPDPIAAAWIATLHASEAYARGALDAFVDGTERAVRLYVEGGDARDACNQRVRLANGWLALGEPSRARAELLLARADAHRMGLRLVEGYALQNLGHAEARAGAHDDARRTLARAIEIATELGDAAMEAGARVYASELALERGRLAEALREAERAVACARGRFEGVARAALARALTRSTDASGAVAAARAGRAIVGPDDTELDARVSLALAEALAAEGRHVEARATAATALDRVRARAALVTTPVLREGLLTRIPEHALLAALASA